MVARPSFVDLRFGRRDAADEASSADSDLLIDGFFDYKNIVSGIESREKYLLLGPKGAGKSAVLEHLRMTWAEQPDKFFTLWDLKGFPISDVRKMKTGQEPSIARTQNSWEFLLLLRVIDSLYEDHAVGYDRNLAGLRKVLIEQGLLAGEWKAKVTELAKSTVKFKIPLVELGVEWARGPVNLMQMVEIVKRILAQTTILNRHVVALDGLDSFFFESESQWESLSGLVEATQSLNTFFSGQGLPVLVVLALRSDIYNVLPSTETNKFKRYAAQLSWVSEGFTAASPLWSLLHKKVQVDHPEIGSIPLTYLRSRVPLGRASTKNPNSVWYMDSVRYMMEYTRLLPRDMIALMDYLQDNAREVEGSVTLDTSGIVAGTKDYCEEYFEGEIFNNLAGILQRNDDAPRKVSAFRDAMRTVPMQVFSFADVQEELDGFVDPGETTALLRQMFEVGAIGIRNQSGRIEHTDFIYRKVGGSGFTKRHGFVLHNALTRAWNRPRS